ncbi:unnamed protein product [Amoebophrya sp. A120]|nr:unnamed protein product [Amoebophrya sp. A120]|eukprot:GSA120T00007109001.1
MPCKIMKGSGGNKSTRGPGSWAQVVVLSGLLFLCSAPSGVQAKLLENLAEGSEVEYEAQPKNLFRRKLDKVRDKLRGFRKWLRSISGMKKKVEEENTGLTFAEHKKEQAGPIDPAMTDGQVEALTEGMQGEKLPAQNPEYLKQMQNLDARGCNTCYRIRKVFEGTVFAGGGMKYFMYVALFLALYVGSTVGTMGLIWTTIPAVWGSVSASIQAGATFGAALKAVLLTPTIIQPALHSFFLMLSCSVARTRLVDKFTNLLQDQLQQKANEIAVSGARSGRGMTTKEAAMGRQQAFTFTKLMTQALPTAIAGGASTLGTLAYAVPMVGLGNWIFLVPIFTALAPGMATWNMPALDSQIAAQEKELERLQEEVLRTRSALQSPDELQTLRENAHLGYSLADKSLPAEKKEAEAKVKLESLKKTKASIVNFISSVSSVLQLFLMYFGIINAELGPGNPLEKELPQWILPKNPLTPTKAVTIRASTSIVGSKSMDFAQSLFSLKTEGYNSKQMQKYLDLFSRAPVAHLFDKNQTSGTLDRVGYRMESVNVRFKIWPERGQPTVDVPGGSFFYLRAPSGGGKSVLLSMMFGSLDPEFGTREILWNGVDLGRAKGTEQQGREMDKENDREMALSRMLYHQVVASQKISIHQMTGTVRDQVLQANPYSLGAKEVVEAAKLAKIWPKLAQYARTTLVFGEQTTDELRKKKSGSGLFSFFRRKNNQKLDVSRRNTMTAEAVEALSDVDLAEKLLDMQGLRGQMSRGEGNRYNLVWALLMRPRVLFMDEATDGLDEPTQLEVVRNIFCFAATRGTTVIFTTHEVQLYARALFGDAHRDILDQKVGNPGCRADLSAFGSLQTLGQLCATARENAGYDFPADHPTKNWNDPLPERFQHKLVTRFDPDPALPCYVLEICCLGLEEWNLQCCLRILEISVLHEQQEVSVLGTRRGHFSCVISIKKLSKNL